MLKSLGKVFEGDMINSRIHTVTLIY